ncbi:vesicle-mediated transport protein [Grosmannia clavigera kw1407]|uniref:Vesicle-mediated transport protein n=1 Tax=Grosmannia clavigera (strain kw1407 / UAMH 11150) TaxID=655863 RepID=F0XNT6_GROCL|nr:vesicle-mediated transport protein [Grosmannia clavigera kw1407]EFX00302.1 vesicle-mediated transport protein [Grosmannia clavigera kw1407]
MPTPSSHRHDGELSFTSLCPDDQAPHAESNWNQPPTPFEQIDRPRREDTLAGSGQVPSAAAGLALPLSLPTMSPIARPGRELTVETETNDTDFFNTGEQDDDVKPAETDLDMAADNVTAGSSAQYAQSNSTVNRSSRRAGTVTSTTPSSTVSSDVWDPYGVTQGINRPRERSTIRAPDALAPSSMDIEKLEEHGISEHCALDSISEGYMGFDPTSSRIIPIPPSTYLRPGSRFVGTQQSERQVYDVQVEIKHVDLRESFLCGYLRIQGLTEDHPTLTTYFEGEIIGSKYGFTTKHKSWGANDRIDMSHWAKFAAFHPFVRQAKKGNLVIKEYLQKENIFMRWKEHFLVPDHRVRTIHGASFEGFYYICFNQVEGVVHGIYFHSKSEKFQQLELKHVEDRGCMSAVEFR